MRTKPLSRRTVLRGLVGGALATVGLPVLEAMLGPHGDALADGSPLPVRLVTWFFGNGVRLDRWVPAAQGPDYPLSEELAPLAKVKAYCSVLTGFNNRCEILVTHHEGMTLFNGYTMTEVSGLFSKAGGPTIDQIAAEKLAGTTPIPSVQIGVSKRLSVMDGGTTLFALSHKGPNQPLYPEFEPKAVYDKLFGSFTPKDDPSGPLRISVLDAVRADAAALRKRLGKKDDERLEAHLEGIATLEKKIAAIPPVCAKPSPPTVTNKDVGGKEPLVAVNDAMSDLVAYAFACDVTRVASILFCGGASETVFSDLGQFSSHHDNTHNPGAQEEVHAAVVFTMQRFATFLEKLMATPDGPNGNLLDNTAILCGSDCSEGYSHSVKDQAVLVAGRGGGALVHPGVHYRSPSGENTTNIALSVLRCVAPSVTEIGAGAPYSNTPCAALAPT